MVIAAFMLGCAVGMCVYRQSIIAVLGRHPYTRCDYCQFRMMMGKKPFPRKKAEEETASWD